MNEIELKEISLHAGIIVLLIITIAFIWSQLEPGMLSPGIAMNSTCEIGLKQVCGDYVQTGHYFADRYCAIEDASAFNTYMREGTNLDGALCLDCFTDYARATGLCDQTAVSQIGPYFPLLATLTLCVLTLFLLWVVMKIELNKTDADKARTERYYGSSSIRRITRDLKKLKPSQRKGLITTRDKQ